MTHISKVLTLAGSLFVANMAIASNWAEVYDDNDATIYVDTDSVRVKDNLVTHWEKVVYKKIQTSANDKPYKSRSVFTCIDCRAKTWGSTSLIEYDIHGKVVNSEHAPLDMKPIPPDSRIDAVSKIVCSTQPKPENH